MIRTVTAADLQRRVVAVRAGEHGGVVHLSGSFQCHCCGGYVVNIAEAARLIGVGAQTLSNWLNRRPIRDDIAAKIRGAFLRVDE